MVAPRQDQQVDTFAELSDEDSQLHSHDGEGINELAALPSEGSPAPNSHRRSGSLAPDDELADDQEDGIDELEVPPPDQNPEDGKSYRHESLEQRRDEEQAAEQQETRSSARSHRPRHTWTRNFTIHCHLVFFSILGVLARIGLQTLTLYPGAPTANTDLWANLAGCFVIGFLREDRALYRWHWAQMSKKQAQSDSGLAADSLASGDAEAQRRQDLALAKASIPSYIGLSVGFCGSLTSFASICRDAYFAIANTLDTAAVSDQVTANTLRFRPAGDSVMALLAIIVQELGLSLVALRFGAHVAVLTEYVTKDVSMIETQRWYNMLIMCLGPAIWLLTVLLAILLPYDLRRTEILFALIFAPVGCVLRFHLSKLLDRRLKAFPMGTFSANILGTCVLGIAYDLQHTIASSSTAGSQVLQGIIDGFCGALTTVSTWVLELDTLRLKHAYVYGLVSLTVAIALLVAIMGSVQWTVGYPTITSK